MWLGAQLLWTYFEVVLRQEVPNPFVGDVILFLHLVPMMAALAVRTPRRTRSANGSSGSARLRSPPDLVALSLRFHRNSVAVRVAEPSRIRGAFDNVYNLGHFAFLVAAAAVWLHSRNSLSMVYATLFGAGLIYALGSMSAGIAIDMGRYYTGSLYDLPLLVSMACFVGVGSIASGLNLNLESTKPAREKRELWVSGAATITILSLPVMAGWALYLSNAPMIVRSFRVLLTLATMILMGTLAWVKQHRLDKELARANRDLREDSFTDLLTGARNRRFLTSTIEGDIGHVLRSYARGPVGNGKRDRDLVFYLIDADAFKEINDKYGHPMGDKVLIEISRRLSSAIRHSDVLIRWGGDEFLVVSRYTDREEAAHLAKRVLNALATEPFEIESCVSLRCTCSIGWAVFPWFIREPARVAYDEVLRLADTALYEAEKAGRNQAVGLLPTREELTSAEDAVPSGKGARLEEQLAARTVQIAGPAAKTEPVQKLIQQKAAAASQLA